MIHYVRRSANQHFGSTIKMTYLVTDIEFDFTDSIDEPLSIDEKSQIIQDSIGCWEAEDEDDLIEEITTATGWCIKNIDYEVQLLT